MLSSAVKTTLNKLAVKFEFSMQVLSDEDWSIREAPTMLGRHDRNDMVATKGDSVEKRMISTVSRTTGRLKWVL
jgi:hypothetical protein